jgi:hypothetical protein
VFLLWVLLRCAAHDQPVQRTGPNHAAALYAKDGPHQMHVLRLVCFGLPRECYRALQYMLSSFIILTHTRYNRR